MMQNKVVIVTGATNGIGEFTAKALATKGATVVLVSRNQARLNTSIEKIKSATGNENISGIQADLSVMAQVRQAAETFLAQYSRLDVLVNNAGAIFENRQESADNYEMTLALNHLNYFLLTHDLLPILQQTANTYGEARILNVSSGAHYRGKIDFQDFQAMHDYNSFRRYSETKLMNILFTYALAKRLQGTGVSVNTLHPGFVDTGFGNNMSFIWRNIIKVMKSFMAKTPQDGAETSIYLASSPEVRGITGKYWDDKKQKRSSSRSYDEASQEKLWQRSTELTGIQTSEPV